MASDDSAPSYRTTRWPGISDDSWGGRSRLWGAALARAWGGFLGRVPWELFGTLTFDPKRVFPVGERRASEETFDWCNLAARLCRSSLVWAYAVERGRGGAWHAHVVLVGAAQTKWGAMAEAWKARNGQALLLPVYDAGGAAMYTSKASALRGEIVLSDTIGQFRNQLSASAVVPLHLGANKTV